MSIEFLIATDDELKTISSLTDAVKLSNNYKISAAGATDFQAINSLSKLFFQNENYVPSKISLELKGEFENKIYRYRFYKLDQKFVEKVASYKEETEIWKLGEKWRESAYWRSRKYDGFGIFNCIFGLNNLCKFAVADKKNLYLWEEL